MNEADDSERSAAAGGNVTDAGPSIPTRCNFTHLTAGSCDGFPVLRHFG
jgi:hypothetical protein